MMAAQSTCISLVSRVVVLVFYGSGVLCAPLCLAGDFTSQLQHILQEQMLSAQDPDITRALHDVRATLDRRWTGYEFILTGSIGVGFGTVASDIDLGINLPNINASAVLYVLQETEKLFNKQPELYSQKKMAPPGYMLQVNSRPHYIIGRDLGFDELPYNTTNTENLHQLLGGFFKYYSEFNFEEYVVSPFTGRPILRSAFTNVESFPEEYTLYDKLDRTILLALRNPLDTAMVVQDVFSYDLNTAYLVSREQALKFKYLMKLVATMFEELPSDRILSAILVMDDDKGTVINHNNVTDDAINKQNCIEIVDPDAVITHA
ncbi:hypothetical protein PYW07_012486 [Mythimna separata]|uniref:PAP-associated domain-containing protein n=1 Tax=Mythimna separata TaxID=271217 RepID=A0AAD7YM85_MYTSE|nr:hypothetical protein PYW07_012486 [Mythimna separata]